MGYRILLAGATGVIGRRLVPLLLQAGHSVVGTTRSTEKAKELRELGVEPVVVDVFDASRLLDVVKDARPEIVIHQLTDLPPGLDPAQMTQAVSANARIRDIGTGNLVAAAIAAGSRKLVAQSIAWAYAPGSAPFGEDSRLDEAAQGDRAISVGGVIALEKQTLGAHPLKSVVLRYGRLYGPGTGADTVPMSMPVHVDAAAYAVLLAVERDVSDIFNIAQDNPEIVTTRAVAELGWTADFRLPGGK